MELSYPAAGRQKRVSSRRSDDHHLQDYYSGNGNMKSFKCTFCKRGFSNAQALGGHMNIHRKDRAKLKFSAAMETEEDEEVLPTVIDVDQSGRRREDVGRIVPRQEILQLPLFLEIQSASHELQSFDGGRTTESFMQWNYDPFPKLDLELRLGPDPEQSHRSKRRTRKFF